MDLFFAKRQAKPKPKFCCTIFSNLGGDALERVKFMQQLSAYKTVDCFGKTSFNNMKHRKDVPKLPQFWWENIAFLSQYKFVICFENSFKEDYVTEKLPNALLSGVIAIYRGAPNVGEYFNTRSFVNFDDFGSYQKMIDEIIAIDQDDEKYNAYLKEPLFPNNQIPRAISDKVEAVKQSIHQLLSSSL